jgi:predicted permease
MQRPGPSEDSIEGAFFTTSGIAIERGRVFTTQDRRDSQPVAIVNQAAARAYWPGEDPIGRRFRFPSDTAKPWVTVVGVAGDMHRQGLENETVPQVFFPLAQQTDDMMEILARTSSDAGALAPLVRSTVQSIDNSVAKFDVLSVEQQLGEQTSDRRFQTLLLTLFSAVALLLSAIGVYGLMHSFVVQRTNEIGVRMALGARYSGVVLLILRQGLASAALGALVGMAGAFFLTRLLAGLLFGATPTDALVFALAPAILLVVAALAAAIPAHRAATIDPVTALRSE